MAASKDQCYAVYYMANKATGWQYVSQPVLKHNSLSQTHPAVIRMSRSPLIGYAYVGSQFHQSGSEAGTSLKFHCFHELT